jgi:hypothetical protein
MSLSDRYSPVDDGQIVRYLLGLLPHEEAERLDEASVADDEFAARLRISEADLVDSYVRGKLDGETVKRFESYYLSSPRRRGNVKLAAGFVQAIDRAAPHDTQSAGDPALVSTNEHEETQSGAAADEQIGSRSKVAVRLMLAAAVLLAVSAVLLLQAVRLGTGPNAAERMAGASRGEVLDRRLATAVVLLPQTRAIGPVPVVAIPPGADHVTFALRLESNDFQQYEVGLEDPASNHVVWRSDAIGAGSADPTTTLSVVVPARVLKPQHYSLTVTGRRASRAEVVGSYAFQLEQR